MKWLWVGGSGYVGSLCMPYLKDRHEIRVLDLFPPDDPDVEFIQGSVFDQEAIRSAIQGVDGAVYMVLGRNEDRSRNIEDIALSYDLSVKGLHLTLQAMKDAGIERAVYASTVSVHGMRPGGIYSAEDTPCDAPTVYGFTKALGEQVCEYFSRVHGMTTVALRLWGPLSQEDWHKANRPDQPCLCVAAPDLARAFLLGLTAPVRGFHALFISGDHEGRTINCARAREVLGWEPLERARPQ